MIQYVFASTDECMFVMLEALQKLRTAVVWLQLFGSPFDKVVFYINMFTRTPFDGLHVLRVFKQRHLREPLIRLEMLATLGALLELLLPYILGTVKNK